MSRASGGGGGQGAICMPPLSWGREAQTKKILENLQRLTVRQYSDYIYKIDIHNWKIHFFKAAEKDIK